MKKKILKDCIYQTSIKNHSQIKNFILSKIDGNKDESLKITNNYYTDSITKLDWSESENLDREWVKFFLPYFSKSIEEIFKYSPFSNIKINDIWYQQYVLNDTHGWHIHGSHYTGVYYLEFPKNSSRTELFFPFDNSIRNVDVKEGDMIIFPSHIVHRGPINKSKRKTIISFNFDILCDKLDINFILNYRKKSFLNKLISLN